MRKVRYQVAMSLDGFIADQQDGYGWIAPEPEFDFAAHFAQFDTLLMGRRTFEAVTGQLDGFGDRHIIVFSRTLQQADHPGVQLVSTDPAATVSELKAQPGKDIWLYGGGELFRSLLSAGLVDTVEPAVMPVLLGGGKRLLPEAAGPWQLKLQSVREYALSGMLLLKYTLQHQAP